MGRSPADNTPRRIALGIGLACIASAVAGASLPVPVPVPEADAELIRLGAEFQRLDARLARFDVETCAPGGSPDDDPAWVALEVASDQWWNTVRAAQDIPATTMQGMQAKALMLASVLRATSYEEDTGHGAVMALVTSMAGRMTGALA
jgi:hypothetical protein